MATTKRRRGYPPRINATFEEVTDAMLSTPPPPVTPAEEYRCATCGETVEWPEILLDDNRCEACR